MNPTTNALELSIVIPAFKESAKIERDIREAHAFLTIQALRGEIIVVDDGSPDDTFEKARALQARYPELVVVRYERNRGKGHALRVGMACASGRNILFADAGTCVPYNVARIGLTMLDLGMCDIAHGSRRMRGSIKRAQPFYRRVGSRIFSLIIHTLMGIPLYIADTQCGFKLYRREVAQRLYAETVTDGFMFDTEVVLRALRSKDQILEFPVLWSNDPDTRFRAVKGTLPILLDLAKIRWMLLSNVKGSSPLEPFVQKRPDVQKSSVSGISIQSCSVKENV
jgi:glycosyltransferase involved in cell wall biosynthesis